MVHLSRPYPFKFFKGYLPQILLGPLLNAWTRLLLVNINVFKSIETNKYELHPTSLTHEWNTHVCKIRQPRSTFQILQEIFLSAIWLARGQLWAIIERIASLTICYLLRFINFRPKSHRESSKHLVVFESEILQFNHNALTQQTTHPE